MTGSCPCTRGRSRRPRGRWYQASVSASWSYLRGAWDRLGRQAEDGLTGSTRGARRASSPTRCRTCSGTSASGRRVRLGRVERGRVRDVAGDGLLIGAGGRLASPHAALLRSRTRAPRPRPARPAGRSTASAQVERQPEKADLPAHADRARAVLRPTSRARRPCAQLEDRRSSPSGVSRISSSDMAAGRPSREDPGHAQPVRPLAGDDLAAGVALELVVPPTR